MHIGFIFLRWLNTQLQLYNLSFHYINLKGKWWMQRLCSDLVSTAPKGYDRFYMCEALYLDSNSHYMPGVFVYLLKSWTKGTSFRRDFVSIIQ